MVKSLLANARGMGSIPGSGSSPGGGKGTPLQASCLENGMDRGAWRGCSPRGRQDLTKAEAAWHACRRSVSRYSIALVLAVCCLISRELTES